MVNAEKRLRLLFLIKKLEMSDTLHDVKDFGQVSSEDILEIEKMLSDIIVKLCKKPHGDAFDANAELEASTERDTRLI